MLERECKQCKGTGRVSIDNSLAEDIDKALKDFGISSFRLSQYCELSPITVNNIIKYKSTPHLKTMIKIRDAIEKIRVEGMDPPKRKGRKKSNVNEIVEGPTSEQRSDNSKPVTQEEEPKRRIFYQAEDDDDWAEEIEAEDGE